MTELASLRESSRDVIGIFGAAEISLVAGYARRTRQVVVVLLVAICALPRGNGVLPRQGKAGHAVIERRIRPLDCVVAIRTTGGESFVRHGSRCVVVIGLMAGNAGRARQIEIVVDMAVRADPGWVRVPTRQREADRVVIELRI